MRLKNLLGIGRKRFRHGIERRQARRLVVHSKVKLNVDETPEDGVCVSAELVDFSAGGLRLRTSTPVAAGDNIWVQARVIHVSGYSEDKEIGVAWDTEEPAVPSLFSEQNDSAPDAPLRSLSPHAEQAPSSQNSAGEDEQSYEQDNEQFEVNEALIELLRQTTEDVHGADAEDGPPSVLTNQSGPPG